MKTRPSRRKGVGLALSLALLASCASMDRMWRISPFAGEGSPERVNLWPLAYHDRGATSVLWPLLDVDERGFALRPLFAKDGARYGVLFPWSSWDADNDQGWAFPFYKLGGNTGLFPVANIGERFSYVGPVYWSRDETGQRTSSGLFPLVRLGGFLNYVLPVWWTSGDSAFGGGLAPLAMFGSFNYVGPFWWSETGSYGFFPLFGRGSITHFGPLWWTAAGSDNPAGGFFPFVYSSRAGKRLTLFPFYEHDLTETVRKRTYLLGLGRTRRHEKGREDWLIPLYYDREEPGKRDTALFPFFWKRTRGDTAEVFTLLGNRRVAANESSLNLYPFWWSSQSEQASWKMLFPFFYYSREGEDRTLLTPLGGRGWNPTEERRYVNILGPVFHRSRNAATGAALTAFLWPLFERRHEGERTTTRVAPFYSSTTSPAGREAWYALGLGHSRTREESSSWRIWPLYSTSDGEESPGFFYDFTLYARKAHEGEVRRRLFPLYTDTSSPNRRELQVLLGLGHYSREGTSTNRSLWPLVSISKGFREQSLGHALTLLGSARWDNGSSFHLGGPLLYRTRRETKSGTSVAQTSLLTFYQIEHETREEEFIPASSRLDRANLVERHAHSFLFDAFLAERETYNVWAPGTVNDRDARLLHAFSLGKNDDTGLERMEEAARTVLSEHGVTVPEVGGAAVRTALADYAAEATATVEHRKYRLPLLFDYERTGGDVTWSGPLWTLMSSKSADSRDFRFLYYVYRSKTEGGRTRRDIFPFITWDSGSDETRFSFLWRLFRYVKRDGKRGGNVFFIPWGSLD